ncbi:TetR/AcrR family transcriptional regulator [Uliginosibacterium sediminicola]|uniref:TetR/AcrR family transcriptional regulator n=1 Tax=Uliginosibacterium sediminicola TaxID=2024550 RepID=A0ABU9YTW1_9RHOO
MNTAADPAAEGSAASRPSSYHHGALPQALLSAVGEVLAEGGADAFSLRAVARRAGVSHAAPAHHFGDARGLLTAYAAQSFAALTQALQAAAAVQTEPVARLKALGAAYVGFALAHPARYQLMFRSARIDAQEPALREASQAAFAQLAQAVAALSGRAQALDARDPQVLLAWSAVHGFAMLVLERQLDSLRGEAWATQLGAMLDALAPAWAAAR